MDTVNAWNQIIEQSPLFAFMTIVIFFGAKYINSQNNKNEKREQEREERDNALLDKMIETKADETATLIATITANTEVMRRVERKLESK
mgnify:CR=1 FL=1